MEYAIAIKAKTLNGVFHLQNAYA